MAHMVGEKTKRTNREDYCSPKKVQLDGADASTPALVISFFAHTI